MAEIFGLDKSRLLVAAAGSGDELPDPEPPRLDPSYPYATGTEFDLERHGIGSDPEGDQAPESAGN